MSAMKLVYFDGQGRGEIIRLVLAASNTNYDEDRISRVEWPQLKPSIKYQQLPILKLGNDKEMNESLAIARYLARTTNLYGKSDWESYLVDRACDTIYDLLSKIFNIHCAHDEVKKVELENKFKENEMDIYLGNISKYIAESEGDFIAGSSPSLGDLALILIVDYMAEDAANYPKIMATYHRTIEVLPNLQKYVASRRNPISMCH